MPTIPARKIPEPSPNERTILVPWSPQVLPVARGSGKTNYSCETCHTLLVENIDHGQFRNIVIKCPKCASYNEIP
jgi:hypothetical protein